jgi:phospho-N-acetylmuramoyl-pentapeptide-transferase
MGGVLILFTFMGSVFVWGDWHNSYLWIVVVTALLFGGIGFLDQSKTQK